MTSCSRPGASVRPASPTASTPRSRCSSWLAATRRRRRHERRIPPRHDRSHPARGRCGRRRDLQLCHRARPPIRPRHSPRSPGSCAPAAGSESVTSCVPAPTTARPPPSRAAREPSHRQLRGRAARRRARPGPHRVRPRHRRRTRHGDRPRCQADRRDPGDDRRRLARRQDIYEAGIATGNATFETTAPSWERGRPATSPTTASSPPSPTAR